MKSFLRVAICWAVLGFASTAQAQNTTCATRPLGDNSNACASTAFVAVNSFSPAAPLVRIGTGVLSTYGTAITITGTITSGSAVITGISAADIATITAANIVSPNLQIFNANFPTAFISSIGASSITLTNAIGYPPVVGSGNFTGAIQFGQSPFSSTSTLLVNSIAAENLVLGDAAAHGISRGWLEQVVGQAGYGVPQGAPLIVTAPNNGIGHAVIFGARVSDSGGAPGGVTITTQTFLYHDQVVTGGSNATYTESDITAASGSHIQNEKSVWLGGFTAASTTSYNFNAANRVSIDRLDFGKGSGVASNNGSSFVELINNNAPGYSGILVGHLAIVQGTNGFSPVLQMASGGLDNHAFEWTYSATFDGSTTVGALLWTWGVDATTCTGCQFVGSNDSWRFVKNNVSYFGQAFGTVGATFIGPANANYIGLQGGLTGADPLINVGTIDTNRGLSIQAVGTGTINLLSVAKHSSAPIFSSLTGYVKANGASAATAAGTIPLSDLATQATNTIDGNATASSAAPTALAIGSCSSASSALIWTTNTGFGCNTSITASLANPTASVGLSAVNGTATSAMRSDGAPALSQAISPTWTGTHIFTNSLIKLLGSSTGATTFTSDNAGASNFTLHIPGANDTMAVLAAAQALTNKDLTGAGNTFPTFNQNTSGSAAKWTTARNLAGNSVDGSANVAFANKVILQGTTDAGFSSAQFLGALGTCILKNTTTTGVLSCTTAGTDYLTSVGLSFTGGLISVGSTPLTSNGTIALTVTGVSGGIAYFSSTSTWASSALLAANAIMIGGGAGTAPTTTTTGANVLTALGVAVGTDGAFVVKGGAGGTPSAINLSNGTALPAATGIANGALPAGVTINNGNWSGTVLSSTNGGVDTSIWTNNTSSAQVTWSGGTPTTTTVVTGFKQVGKSVHWRTELVPNTNLNGATGCTIAFPFTGITAADQSIDGINQTNNSLFTLKLNASATSFTCAFASALTAGNTYTISGTVEVQ